MKREKRQGCLRRVGVESGVWSLRSFFVIMGVSCVLCLQLASPKTTLRGVHVITHIHLARQHIQQLYWAGFEHWGTQTETGQQMVPEMAGKPSRDAQEESSAEKYKDISCRWSKIRRKYWAASRIRCDEPSYYVKTQFYKSAWSNCSKWYKNMIVAILK